MLEADESDSFTFDDELTGVRGTDTDHKHNVDIRIYIEEGPALLFCVTGQRDDVNSLEHCAKVYTARKCGRANDFQKMRPRRIQHVVMPVGLQEAAVNFEVAEIGGETDGNVVNC